MGILDKIYAKAKADVKKIILAESDEERTLTAISIILKENYAKIMLIGNKDKVSRRIQELSLNIDLERIEFVDPLSYRMIDELSNDFYELRKSKGMTQDEAKKMLVENEPYLAMMLLYKKIGDGFVSGAVHRSSADTIKPALQILKTKDGISKVSSFFLMVLPDGKQYIFSDCALNINPTSDELAEIAYLSAKSAKWFDMDPKIAMLSFSTKGSGADASVDKVRNATEIAKTKFPNLVIDGELQLDAAIVESVAKQKAPGSSIAGSANILIFPDLNSGNIGYKLVQRFANAKAIGPILQGLRRPVSDLSRGCTAQDIVDAVCIVAVEAQDFD